jgi:hypothetical protein
LPVLEPTTFPLAADDVAGWTVVRRRNRSAFFWKFPFLIHIICGIQNTSYWAWFRIRLHLGLLVGLLHIMLLVVKPAVPRPNPSKQRHKNSLSTLKTLLGIFGNEL